MAPVNTSKAKESDLNFTIEFQSIWKLYPTLEELEVLQSITHKKPSLQAWDQKCEKGCERPLCVLTVPIKLLKAMSAYAEKKAADGRKIKD